MKTFLQVRRVKVDGRKIKPVVVVQCFVRSDGQFSYVVLEEFGKFKSLVEAREFLLTQGYVPTWDGADNFKLKGQEEQCQLSN